MKTKNINPGDECIDTLRLKCKIMDRVMHIHVHTDVNEFSKTGEKGQASVIDSAKIMLFLANVAVKMPIK